LFFYGFGAKEDRLETKAGPIYGFLAGRLWFDELYNFYVANIQQRVAELLGFIDLVIIKGLIVRGSAGVVGAFSICAKALHVGSIHNYVYWFLGGLVLFMAAAAGIF